MVATGGCLGSAKLICESAGHDKILPKLLRDSADIIAPSFAAVLNQSILPDDLKLAIISHPYINQVIKQIATIVGNGELRPLETLRTKR